MISELPWPEALTAAAAALDTTLRSEDLTVKNAARSYRHVNGFTKLFVAPQIAGEDWSIHVWPRSDDGGDIHNHRWDFGSTVLEGELWVERFEMATSQDQRPYDTLRCRSFLHAPLGPAEGFTLIDTGRRDLRRVSQRKVRQGSDYFGAAEDLHVVHGAPGCGATTLFRRSETVRWETDVMRPEAATDRPSPSREILVTHFDPQVFASQLRKVRHELARTESD